VGWLARVANVAAGTVGGVSSSGGRGAPDGESVEALVAGLDPDEVAALLVRAALEYDDVARAVQLAAAPAADRVRVLRSAIDEGLRTRRFLGYRESSAWASDGRVVVEDLAAEVIQRPSRELVVLLERAIGHVVKVILHADDSDGAIGGLATELLDLHAQVCDAGVADPVALARWMVRFTFEDQDFFVVDPVRYAAALGDRGVATYRREAAKRSTIVSGAGKADRRFAESYALERLAVLDRDVPRLVELLGGDLRSPHQFVRLAETMAEIGDLDAALAWARRGIAETSGWQVAKLYDLAARILGDRGDTSAVLALRRGQHERMPSASTYALLRSVAETEGRWDSERPAARQLLEARDPGGYIDALLGDGEPPAAWAAAVANPAWDLGDQRWERLAHAREPDDPAAAMYTYLRLADSALRDANRNAYRVAVRYLQAARRATASAELTAAFDQHITALRERHRRRPTFVALLDKAKLR
jgi:hypothetical protein